MNGGIMKTYTLWLISTRLLEKGLHLLAGALCAQVVKVHYLHYAWPVGGVVAFISHAA